MTGFLGTHAGFCADVNFVAQVMMGLALLAGAWLARSKRYRAHAACMASVLLLNLALIATIMWPSFDHLVLPRIPRRLGRPFFAISALHGLFGAITELLGIYILLVAGTNWLPQAMRFSRWKIWMRTEIVLWWTVLLLGIGTYFIWYGVPTWH